MKSLSSEDLNQIVSRLETAVDVAVKSHVTLLLPSLLHEALRREVTQRMWDEVAGAAIRQTAHDAKKKVEAHLRKVLEPTA